MREERRGDPARGGSERPDERVVVGPEGEGEGSSRGGGDDRGSGRDTGGESGEGKRSGEQKKGGKQEQEGEGKGGGKKKGAGPTPAQWAVGIGSSLLVLALLGYVLYLAIEGSGRPPVIQVRVERVLEAPAGYVVEVGVYNEGGTTASTLVIEGTLKRDTTTIERSNATLAYVPADTEREAGLFFTRDPRRYRLELRPVGYDRP